MPLELLERNRFLVLQRLYDLAAGDTERRLELDAPSLAGELDIPEADVSQAVAFLVHAHYLSEAEMGGELCITRRAVYYIEAGAYQRQTIRD